MRHLLPSWSSLALLTPFFAACAVHADVPPPAVSAQVDVNGQAVATADATATATTDGTTTDTYEDTDPSALTDFHTALASHGTWVEDPTYGTVWVPSSMHDSVVMSPAPRSSASARCTSLPSPKAERSCRCMVRR